MIVYSMDPKVEIMIDVVTEAELNSVDIRTYDDVLAVLPGDRDYGVQVWRARRIATIYGPRSPAKVTISRTLLIEVENPDDLEVHNRLEQYCFRAWRGE